jgi:hypothetical protein
MLCVCVDYATLSRFERGATGPFGYHCTDFGYFDRIFVKYYRKPDFARLYIATQSRVETFSGMADNC